MYKPMQAGYILLKTIKGILSNKGKLVGAVKTVTGNQKAANAVSKISTQLIQNYALC